MTIRPDNSFDGEAAEEEAIRRDEEEQRAHHGHHQAGDAPRHCMFDACNYAAWDEWRVPVYDFGFGPSLTRGCFFAWFLLHLPYVCYRVCSHHSYAIARNLVSSDGQPSGCGATLAGLLGFLLHFCVAVVWVLSVIILILPWLFLYLLFALIEVILILVWGITCGYCHKRDSWVGKGWKAFGCSGWVTDWAATAEGDPYTQQIWHECSPVHTMCGYNFPYYTVSQDSVAHAV